jgi:hypothetical protein
VMKRGTVHSRSTSAPQYMAGIYMATVFTAEVGGLVSVEMAGSVGHYGSAALWAVTWGLSVDGQLVSQFTTQGPTPGAIVPVLMRRSLLLPRGNHSFWTAGVSGTDATWGWSSGAMLSVVEL